MGLIEVRVVNKKGESQTYGISKENIPYFRGYVESSPKEGVAAKLKTVGYLRVRTKALMVDIPYPEFANKYKEC